MRILGLVLLIVPLHATDQRKLALEATAQGDFERVTTQRTFDLASASTCIDSQAMLLAVATPEETSIIVFRKAYCALVRAIVTDDHASFAHAGDIFDDAIADAQSAAAKQKVPVNVAPSWRILAAVARLNAGASGESQEQSLTSAVDASECQTNAAPGQFCLTAKQLGSAWLGWIAFGKRDRIAAASRFAVSNTPAWTEWLTGRDAFGRANYSEAVSDYGRAIEAWRGDASSPTTQRLYPRPDMSAMLTEWGGARLLTDDRAGAISTLDAALRVDPSNARAFFLRGLAKARSTRDEALDDYDRASRAAFAQVNGDTGAAEAHFYRGVLLYRRKEFVRAENEFASALNADEPMPWRADARAWRGLSAVAGGSCGASREYLQGALASVSPYFPKREALDASAACPATALRPPVQ